MKIHSLAPKSRSRSGHKKDMYVLKSCAQEGTLSTQSNRMQSTEGELECQQECGNAAALKIFRAFNFVVDGYK